MPEVPLPHEVDATVVLYTTPYCGFCHRARALLKAKDQPYQEIDVRRAPQMRAWLVGASGQRTVPQIFIRGQSVGGFQELAALDRRGELDEMLARPTG